MAQHASLLACIQQSLFDRARRISYDKAGADAKYDMQSFKESKSQVGQRKSARRAIAEMLQRHAALSGDTNHTPTDFDIDLIGAEISHTSLFAIYQKEACYFWAPGNVVLAIRGDGVRNIDFAKQQKMYRPLGDVSERAGRAYRRAVPTDAGGNVFVRPPSAAEQAVQAATNAITIAATNAALDSMLPTMYKNTQKINDHEKSIYQLRHQFDKLLNEHNALRAELTALKNRINLSEHSKAVQSRVAHTMSTLGIDPSPSPAPEPVHMPNPDIDRIARQRVAEMLGRMSPEDAAHARGERYTPQSAPTQEVFTIDPEYADLIPTAPPGTNIVVSPHPAPTPTATVPVPLTPLPQPTLQNPELAPAFTSVEDIFAFMNEVNTAEKT